ncbi:asparagine synthase (glutamine-hydrolyzing), partial [Alphaproteobacteria bacterium]|nr:asparagine synthase (glutamine-hydrolyzing) [Alphaproteobacteria bacterium]
LMCGIAGILGKLRDDDAHKVKLMCDIIAYRGPDAGNVLVAEKAILGHRRLSIIDLSEKSNQPLICNNFRYVITFNGEIYNYIELKKELSSTYKFITNSDTEVILASYIKWGVKSLNKFLGMFAFCIYDLKEEKAFFARDRFGQKPIFYWQHDGRLVFASEIKSLIAAGYIPQPNINEIYNYLATSRYDNNKNTFFSNIFQLQPGEYGIWELNKSIKINRYYNLLEKIEEKQFSENQAISNVRSSMIDACNLHMRSDVPIGVSLSGGLDSSALLSCINTNSTLDTRINCFSVDFGSEFSERQWIEAAASYHNQSSKIISFSISNFLESIDPCMWHLEGPIGGLMNCALTSISKTARENGVTVLQDGTGIDEAFGGYQNHHSLFISELEKNNSNDFNKSLIEYASNWGLTVESARAIIDKTLHNQYSAIDGTKPEDPDLLSKKFIKNSLNYKKVNFDHETSVKLELIDYLTKNKIPRNMRMKDRVTMAYGVELRLPFLDHRLIELALSLPTKFFFLNGYSKSIVRQALKDIIDPSVTFAKKRSIQAPQGKWLKSKIFQEYINDMINSYSFANRDIFDVNKVKEKYIEFCSKDMENSFFVWQWINIDSWYRVFIDNKANLKQLHLMKNFKHINETKMINLKDIRKNT